MIQKTNTITKNRQQSDEIVADEQVIDSSQLTHDVKTAVLIVSVVANLIVLTAWIAVQVTSRYDSQLASLLFRG
jgi:hypothetical protein